MMSVFHHLCGVREAVDGSSQHRPCENCEAVKQSRFRAANAYYETSRRAAIRAQEIKP